MPTLSCAARQKSGTISAARAWPGARAGPGVARRRRFASSARAEPCLDVDGCAHLRDIEKQGRLRRRQTDAAVGCGIARQISFVKTSRAVEPEEMPHRRLHEARAGRHGHGAVRVRDQRFAARIHDFAIERGEMIFVLFQHLELSRGRRMPRSAARDRRFIDDLSLLQKKGFLRPKIDIDRERSVGAGGQRAGEEAKKEDAFHGSSLSEQRATRVAE